MATRADFAKRMQPLEFTYRRTRGFVRYLRFLSDFETFRRMMAACGERFPLRWKDRKPCTGDGDSTHGFDRHYVYHPAWAARILAETRPEYHVDISSTLSFSAMLSAFIPVHYCEFRTVDVRLSDLSCSSANLVKLPFADEGVSSLSCMHVIEHIGLGRYGDKLDPNGDLAAVAELKRVLAVGGSLLFVVPVGKPRIEFNAHRVYSYEQVIDCFRGLELRQFSLIPDSDSDGGLVPFAPQDMVNAQAYGCGCFWFVKNRSTE